MGRTAPLAGQNSCRAVSEVLSRVGDKWSVLVIVAVRERPHRFNELKRKVGGISQQMLTSTLKTLERDGLVTRTVMPTTPPQVSYALTDLGRSLSSTLRQLAEWSIDNLATIQESRRQYDEGRPT
ncbi:MULTISPECIES: helix-turn-helix domain-containing protein [Chelatococcus]|uniref:Transcriptional regulator, HxlR family n=1 Tax=Chelatococcus sambhunathii TaxID=363953 RepID=A0ABP2A5R9_9HYPH|nr:MULTISPECIES: helix-turn-helix domain-containing protein [Chelatococcus]ALA18538.1 HxlR family transcriptional regulator [Chelatococcus sp. CO-6]CUA89227.1 transcriptional regulator, HxlR family [Chelatococcus sambhunathii]